MLSAKLLLENIGALSDCDIEFGFGSRNEFVERAIRRGGAFILEQEGNVTKGGQGWDIWAIDF